MLGFVIITIITIIIITIIIILIIITIIIIISNVITFLYFNNCSAILFELVYIKPWLFCKLYWKSISCTNERVWWLFWPHFLADLTSQLFICWECHLKLIHWALIRVHKFRYRQMKINQNANLKSSNLICVHGFIPMRMACQASICFLITPTDRGKKNKAINVNKVTSPSHEALCWWRH